jgi:hypothetical protein
MAAEEIKLLPCPFCGWEVQQEYASQSQQVTTEEDGEAKYVVCCPSCAACTCYDPTWAGAVANWNRRPDTMEGANLHTTNTERVEIKLDDCGNCKDKFSCKFSRFCNEKEVPCKHWVCCYSNLTSPVS